MKDMVIGVDFDNTIVCYDQVFHDEALAKALINADIPVSKDKIRNYLRAAGQEDKWTELQGYVYGCCMRNAAPFPGVINFFKYMRSIGIALYIVSHKTKYPYSGPQYDLHAAAYQWLDKFSLLDSSILGRDCIFFCETKQAKCEKINTLCCTHFIDDLPEFLLSPFFPKQTKTLLFAPIGGASNDPNELQAFKSWRDIQQYFLGGANEH